MSATWYRESGVASLLGLPRDHIKVLRDEILEKKRDWRMDGREVVISKDALERVLTFLGRSTNQAFEGVNFDAALVFPIKNGGRGPQAALERPALIELTVFRLFPNPRLLMAKAAPEDAPVRVQVPRADNFRAGMKLKARPVGNGIYRMEGRCPRYPGHY